MTGGAGGNRSKGSSDRVSDPYVVGPRRGGMPRPELQAPDRRPWPLATEGACANVGEEVRSRHVFDVDDSAEDPERAAMAKSSCARCPLRRACLEYAMGNEPYGIWGGLDAKERRAARGGPLYSYEERVAAEKIREAFVRGKTAGEVAEAHAVTRRTIERWREEAGLVVPRTEGAGGASAA